MPQITPNRVAVGLGAPGSFVTVRTNFVSNPNMETNATGWVGLSSATVTRDTTQHHSGTASLKVVTPGAVAQEGGGFVVSTSFVNLPCSTGAWLLVPAGVQMLSMIRSGSPLNDGITFFTGTGAWQFVAAAHGAFSDMTSANLLIRTANAQAVTFYIDDAIMEAAAVCVGSFDGSTAASGDFTYAWTGPTNASTSIQQIPGQMVEVTSYIQGPEGVTFSYGRQDEFRDTGPAQFSFTLENQDGRFTPNNPATPYAVPMTEGLTVSWVCGTRLVSGSIQSIGFASSEDQWGRIVVTCTDVLGVANRTYLTDLASDAAAANAWLYWPFNDPAGSASAAEINGGPSLAPDIDPEFSAVATFGITATAPTADTQVQLTEPTTNLYYFDNALDAVFPTITYPAGSLGYWGFWVTPVTVNWRVELDVELANGWVLAFSGTQQGNGTNVSLTITGTPVGVSYLSVPWQVGVAHYLAVGVTNAGTTYTATIFFDGVAVGSGSWTNTVLTNAQAQPVGVRFMIGDGVYITTANVAHLSHAPILIHEEAAGPTTETARLQLLDQVVPQLTLWAVDPALSSAPIGVQQSSGNTALAALLDVMRTEQGQIYSTTTGTFLNPVQTVNIRARTRPSTVSATFDAAADVSGVPQFLRDITNTYSSVTATGPSTAVTVTDSSLVPRVGSATDSETILNVETVDLQEWAQDRLLRGENPSLRVASVVIDALTASDATTTALFGLTLGDRVRITNLPSTQLGFSQWDGWLLGVTESHTPGATASDTFTLYLAAVLPQTGVFDTDVFADGSNNLLNATVTSTATSITVNSADTVTWFERSATGYTIQVDTEQMTVTAAGAPSGGVQTLTVTRGVNSTVAAAHTAAATVEVIPTALFAF